MKIIHISYGGPDRRIRDATGKVWRFEMHPYCGARAQLRLSKHALLGREIELAANVRLHL